VRKKSNTVGNNCEELNKGYLKQIKKFRKRPCSATELYRSKSWQEREGKPLIPTKFKIFSYPEKQLRDIE
jgi:hypothetical protein